MHLQKEVRVFYLGSILLFEHYTSIWIITYILHFWLISKHWAKFCFPLFPWDPPTSMNFYKYNGGQNFTLQLTRHWEPPSDLNYILAAPTKSKVAWVYKAEFVLFMYKISLSLYVLIYALPFHFLHCCIYLFLFSNQD